MTYWDLLEIEPTKDKDIIRKAYSDLTKIYHPEVYPEEFKRLQAAYKSALSYAKDSKNIQEASYSDVQLDHGDTTGIYDSWSYHVGTDESSTEPEIMEKVSVEPEIVREPNPPEWMLNQGEKGNKSVQEHLQQLLDEFMNLFSSIYYNEIYKKELGCWMYLFELKEYQRILKQPIAWYRIALFLKNSGGINQEVSYYFGILVEMNISDEQIIKYLKSVVKFSEEQLKPYTAVTADSDRIDIFFSAAEKYFIDLGKAVEDSNLFQVNKQIETIVKKSENVRKKKYKYSFLSIPVVIVVIILRTFILNQDNEETSRQTSNYQYSDYDLGIDLSQYSDIIDPLYHYIPKDNSYRIAEESYEFSETINSAMHYFDITYPEISYYNGTDMDGINQYLKTTAESIAKSDSITMGDVKEDRKNGLYGNSLSTVGYEIPYMDENLISVIFKEDYTDGFGDRKSRDLFTRNINLKTGENYDLEDVFLADETFASLYLKKLREDNSKLQDEVGLTNEDVLTILQGKSTTGKYWGGFALLKDSIVIYLNYGNENYNSGYQYVYFTYNEISSYKINDEFWALVSSR